MDRVQNIPIRKPTKYCNFKELPTISLVCQMYTLYEIMILNRIAPTIELHLINEQDGFRPGKSFTSQLLNITQHIQDDYQESMEQVLLTCLRPYDHQGS